MSVAPSINLQAARNNSGELCNLGVDLLHSNFSHSSTSTVFISVTVVTLSEARRRWILLLRIVHMRSIGLKSGELDAHSNIGMPCFSSSDRFAAAFLCTLWTVLVGVAAGWSNDSEYCFNIPKDSGRIILG